MNPLGLMGDTQRDVMHVHDIADLEIVHAAVSAVCLYIYTHVCVYVCVYVCVCVTLVASGLIHASYTNSLRPHTLYSGS